MTGAGPARRLTQRWEASLWLTGKQLYLGGFESEEDAAHAYDLAALACKGRGVPTNFPASKYSAELAEVAAYSQVPPARTPSAWPPPRPRMRGACIGLARCQGARAALTSALPRRACHCGPAPGERPPLCTLPYGAPRAGGDRGVGAAAQQRILARPLALPRRLWAGRALGGAHRHLCRPQKRAPPAPARRARAEAAASACRRGPE